MTRLFLRLGILFSICLPLHGVAQSTAKTFLANTSTYTAELQPGEIPRVIIRSHSGQFFRLPVVSGLSTVGAEEELSNLQIAPATHAADGATVLAVTAKSSIWTTRRFVWRFYRDHIEFQQFATGDHPVMRAYFFSNGISALYANGTSRGIADNTIIDADQYFSPNADFDEAFYHPIEESQSLGVAGDPGQPHLSREQASGLFSPPPLMLSFGHGAGFSSIGIGTEPGKYQFNGLEYSGEHFAGASFWVNYQGKTSGADFASPVAAIHFGATAIITMSAYVRWMDSKSFSTASRSPAVAWHHLPIFCGWGEQTSIANSPGEARPANTLATQENYTKWIRILEQRNIPAGTIIIDDKWSKKYGTLDIDEKKWPDMKRFVDEQHAHGRHVLLWVPVASTEGLPKDLTVTRNGNPVAADVSNPRYEVFLRAQIRHLVVDIGIDGFKEDWVGAPADYSGLSQSGAVYGLEFVRRFQSILFDESHKWKPDALIETQTPDPEFRDSSDVLRLNDVYIGDRGVAKMMEGRAAIAHAAGWKLVDTDNAATTTLAEWWSYMQAQPTIGIPALYFVSRTTVTHESPSDAQWSQLAALWRGYIAQQKAANAHAKF